MLTDEQRIEARHKLAAGRVTAYRAMPYYTRALLSIEIFEREGIGTFGVDKYWRLYYDPEKCIEWTTPEIAAVWLHEVNHLIRNHNRRFEALEGVGHDHQAFNRAADAAINTDLKEQGFTLPNPERRVYVESKLAPDWKKGMTAEQMYWSVFKNGQSEQEEKSEEGESEDVESDDSQSDSDENPNNDLDNEEDEDGDDDSESSEDSSSDDTDSESESSSDSEDSGEDDSEENTDSEKSKPSDGSKEEDEKSESNGGGGEEDPDENEGADESKGDSSGEGTPDDSEEDDESKGDSGGGGKPTEDSVGDSKDSDSEDSDGEESSEENEGKISTDCGSCAGGAPREYEEKSDEGAINETSAEWLRKKVSEDIVDYENSNPGSVPGDALRDAKNAIEPQVDWNEEFQAFTRRIVASTRGYQDYTYARPSRRSSTNVIMPGMKAPNPPTIAVVLDTSASMQIAKELAAALGELEELVDRFGRRSSNGGIHIINCDAGAQASVLVRDIRDFQMVGGGGTDMSKGIEYAAKIRPRADIIIVITDGGTPWPKVKPNDNPNANYLVLIVNANPNNTAKSKVVDRIPEWMHVIEVNISDSRRPR